MYIELVESTATLEHILCCVHDKWGETTYYIFTADKLALEESAATQGLLQFISNFFDVHVLYYMCVNFSIFIQVQLFGNAHDKVVYDSHSQPSAS